MSNVLRKDFPYLTTPLIYFDNAATTQKPSSVLEAMYNFYVQANAPVHRGIYKRAEYATQLFEEARVSVAQFIQAHADEIIFTKGATESINAVAAMLADQFQEGDEIIITQMEHHANVLPWMRLAQQKGLVLKTIPLQKIIHEHGHEYHLDYDAYRSLLSEKTKLVACVYTSNVLGTTNDVQTIIELAHLHGAKVLIDAAQTVAHKPLNVAQLRADFIVFSGHKMLGPMGVGVLYIQRRLHATLHPYQVGGGMVFSVSPDCFSWREAPYKYEAGTPPVAEAVGLQAAIKYLENNTILKQATQQSDLVAQVVAGFQKHQQIEIVSSVGEESHMVTWSVKDMHAHDVAAYLDTYDIAVRAGHHCTQPLHTYLGIESTLRASFYIYNTAEEVEMLIKAMNTLLS